MIPGYTVEEEIHRGTRRVVFRATRQSDGCRVIVKTFVDEFPSAADTAGLRREYEILRHLDLEGVARVQDLVTHRDRPALILEGTDGASLKQQIPHQGFGLAAFFEVAVPLAATLVLLHERGFVHKDVNPNNVLYDPTRRRVTLTDFGIASQLPPGRPPIQPPKLLEGTIAYMSPEQTGRMNRDVDYRTDFYSLGATFYELLTGRLPFDSPDPLDVIHGHIARTPPSPRDVNPRIPAPLSELVMKLLAKSPEDRYQSGHALEADLKECAAEWDSTGGIERVRPGRRDVNDRFAIPQKLYGRDVEVATLKAGFDRVCAGGAELMLVSGYSGIGKTALVHEVHRSLAQRRGQFAAGKFDQLGRDVPYVAIVQAFRTVVRHLLAESEPTIRAWAERFVAALGANARLITDMIPELERIVGPQPEVPALDPAEAQNRLNLAFQRFVGVVAQPEHPLVLFLDDLQWADLATLTLVPLLFGGEASRGLLVIGAYRDQEVSATHRLHATVADLITRGVRVEEITLSPLDRATLQELVSDVLRSDPARAAEVSDLVHAKTGGNPFFVTQFLRTLHQEQLIVFDQAQGAWRADLDAIRKANITDNVVELMAGKIRRLAAPTQRVLRLAACAGNRFDLATLATIAEQTAPETVTDLWSAVEQGLVLSEDTADRFGPHWDSTLDATHLQLRFLHDRVQQAAYAQIPDRERPAMHLQVGRLLLARGSQEVTNAIFEVVNHLNCGRDLITTPEERVRLAELNLEAGWRAKASGAYASAGVYFATGAALLDAPEWAARHPLAFALHLERAEADYLCGRYAEAETGFSALLERCRSPIESAEVHIRSIALFETMARFGDAIRAGLDGLRVLGVGIPEPLEAVEAALRHEVDRIDRALGDRPVSSLVDLPRLADATTHHAMRLLMAIWAPAYISGRHPLHHLVVARMVVLSLEHGNCEESAFGYLHHAVNVGYSIGDYGRAYQFGLLALDLNERLADLRLHAAVHHRFAALVNPWSRPFESCIVHARLAVRAGLESGHLQVAAYAQFQQSWYAMMLEPDLDEFQQRCIPSLDALARLKSPAFLEAQRLIAHWGLALQGRTESPTQLSSAAFDEAAFRQTVGGGIFKGLYATIRLELLDTFQHVEAARRAAEDDEQAAEQFASSIWPALFVFRRVLALAAWLPGASMEEREPTLAKLDSLEARLRLWAANAPDNFGHMHRLACAEIARVRGRAGEAMEHYEAAIGLTERQPSPRHRALGNELFGRFWLERGQPRIAAAFLEEARYGYEQWAASAKVNDMNRRYEELLAPGGVRHRETDAGMLRPPLATTRGNTASLDVMAVVRAAQVLSGEIELTRVLEALMRIVLQNAGGRRACLILNRKGEWRVEAEGSAEPDEVRVLQGTPLEASDSVPRSIANYVARTGESVVLADGTDHHDYAGDPYFARHRPRAVLCTPVTHQNRRIGLLYLENDLTRAAFTLDRIEMLQLLSVQAAIAIQNAELFAEVKGLHERLKAENVYLLEEIKTQQGFKEIVGRSVAHMKALSQVKKVAETDATVLITGETGTGKELLARAIHRLSRRGQRTLVTVNCGAISPGLVESELFGHERGAFTGAVARKVGRFELADGGTIFLDEIGDLAPDLQVKLLRVLQEGEIDRVGGTRPIRVDVRVITATHRDLGTLVQEGRFREDLFYRLNVFPIHAPALRERPEDIPLLVRYFTIQHSVKLGKKIESIPGKVLDTLKAYAWPGNIRELSNLVERSVIISSGSTLELRDWSPTPASVALEPAERSLEQVEREHILTTLDRTGWRVSGPQGAARVLGLKPTTLEARMKRLGIQRLK